jgi:outer membrane protein TolC
VFQVLNLNTLFAQETDGKMRLSPDEAVDLAIRNNLTLEIQRAGTDTKKRASDYVWNKFLPAVSLSAGPSLNSQNSKATGDFQTPGQTEQTQATSSAGFQGQVQAQLAINFALFEGIKSLKLDYQTGLLSLEQAKSQLERDVRKSYYSIMLLEEQWKLLNESLNNAEQQRQSMESQYKAGRQPELSYLQARVNVETMKPSVDEAANGLRLAKSSFAMTLGLPLDTDFELALPVDGTRYIPLDTKDLVRQARDNNPDILVRKHQLRTLLSQRKAQVYQKMTPNLSLGWTGGLSSNGSKTGVETNLSDSITMNQDVLSTSSAFTLMLSWTATSLLPFSVDAQAIKDLDNNIKTLSIQIALAEQSTELELNNKVYSLEQIRANIDARRAAVELAERSYNETMRAYNSGLQSLLQVQDAEEKLRTARMNLYQQESGYLQGLIELEYSIGLPFGTLMTQSEDSP